MVILAGKKLNCVYPLSEGRKTSGHYSDVFCDVQWMPYDFSWL